MQKITPLGLLENTVNNSPKFLGIDGFFCFSSICKFGRLKNPTETTTSLSELYFRFRGFTLLFQTKKQFFSTMAAAQAAENHADESGLT